MAMNPRLLVPRQTFSPKSIAGLNLWIDFSDTSTVTLDVNNKISAVTDKSGKGYNGTQTTSANRLGVSTLNGRQCADNGTASNALAVLYSAGANTSNWRHIFVVAVWDGGGSTWPAFNSFMSATANGGTENGAVFVGSSGSAVMLGISTMHKTNVSRWRFNGGSYTSTALTFPYFNGTPFIMNGDYQSAVGINGWMIGNDRGNAGRGWRGRIAEVMSFDRSLSEAEAKRLERYAGAKWGLTIT